jgi:hypothetical protein
MSVNARVLSTVAVVAVVSLVTGACTGASTGPGPTPSTSTPSPSAPPREPFAFGSVKATADPVTGKGGAQAAARARDGVRDALASFYDAAFADPSAWSGAVPTGAWDAFDPSVRDRAQRDAESLTIGTLGTALATLVFTQTKLVVRVLVDQHDKAQAAIATVSVDGTGTRTDGTSLALTNRASFLLQPDDGSWLILGYPQVTTSAGEGT